MSFFVVGRKQQKLINVMNRAMPHQASTNRQHEEFEIIDRASPYNEVYN
jgi:hypothetical protein